MIPKIYSTNSTVIEKYCTTNILLLAYELCCFFMNCEYYYFPDMSHTKFNVMKDPKKQFLFKNVLKMIEKYKDKLSTSEFLGFIKAQFEIMKMNEKYDPLITPSMIHSLKAEYRYASWLQLIAQKQLEQKNTESKIDTKYIKYLMNLSKNNIMKIFGDSPKFSDYENNVKKLILMAKAKQITNVYCFSSIWIKKLDKSVVEEIYKYSDSKILDTTNTEDIIKIYKEYFEYETI